MWRGGCIIRAAFLDRIKAAWDETPDLANLLLAPYFRDAIAGAQGAWRRVVASAVLRGVPVPAFASALAWYDGYRSERLPANLLQAQRDYFGAHTYERIDRPRGEFFHTDWDGARRGDGLYLVQRVARKSHRFTAADAELTGLAAVERGPGCSTQGCLSLGQVCLRARTRVRLANPAISTPSLRESVRFAGQPRERYQVATSSPRGIFFSRS